MSGSQTAEVKVYSSDDKIGVEIPHPSTCKETKVAIAKRLGMKIESLPLFGLFTGPLHSPYNVLKDADTIPIGGDFSFSRWSFDLVREAKLFKQDDIATHLLYSEAKYFYLETSKFKPTPSQVEELDSYLDPDFPVERQFMELIQTLPGYMTYVVPECIIEEDIVSNRGTLPQGTEIQCHLDLEKLTFTSQDGNEVLLDWNWRTVRQWETKSSGIIRFEVCVEELNASILRWVTLKSQRNKYIFELASVMCDHLKVLDDKKANPLPTVNPALAGKVQDPLVEFVNGLFHGFNPKFHSIGSS